MQPKISTHAYDCINPVFPFATGRIFEGWLALSWTMKVCVVCPMVDTTESVAVN